MINEKIIIHIPHSSLTYPQEFLDKVIITPEELEKENIFISDYLVDKLISFPANIIKFPYSRLFCDVERFKDDKQEVMSQYKMGVVYQNNSQLKKFINYDETYKNWVITNFYEPHHQKLDNLTKKILAQYNSCYII